MSEQKTGQKHTPGPWAFAWGRRQVLVFDAKIGQTFDDMEFCVVTFTAAIFGILGTTWEEPMFRKRNPHEYEHGEYLWAYLDSGAKVNVEMNSAINAHLKLEAAHD